MQNDGTLLKEEKRNETLLGRDWRKAIQSAAGRLSRGWFSQIFLIGGGWDLWIFLIGGWMQGFFVVGRFERIPYMSLGMKV
jgi:hypothetical protein